MANYADVAYTIYRTRDTPEEKWNYILTKTTMLMNDIDKDEQFFKDLWLDEWDDDSDMYDELGSYPYISDLYVELGFDMVYITGSTKWSPHLEFFCKISEWYKVKTKVFAYEPGADYLVDYTFDNGKTVHEFSVPFYSWEAYEYLGDIEYYESEIDSIREEINNDMKEYPELTLLLYNVDITDDMILNLLFGHPEHGHLDKDSMNIATYYKMMFNL